MLIRIGKSLVLAVAPATIAFLSTHQRAAAICSFISCLLWELSLFSPPVRAVVRSAPRLPQSTDPTLSTVDRKG